MDTERPSIELMEYLRDDDGGGFSCLDDSSLFPDVSATSLAKAIWMMDMHGQSGWRPSLS